MAGIIAHGTHSLDCTFRNLSATGARITVNRNAQLPSDFYLISIRDRVAYDAQMVWNDGAEAGVTFRKGLPLADITDTRLSFLKRLWLSKATS